MRKLLETIVLGVVVLVIVYVGRDQLVHLYDAGYEYIAPCSRPIAYHIGSYDERFRISKEAFAEAVLEAETIWEKAAGRELFVYEEEGPLAIHLVYDYRQEATDRLKTLGLVVKDDRASYDTLKVKYDSLESIYADKQAVYDRAVDAFTTRRDAYDAEVAQWNRRGGAPRDVYESLQREKSALASELADIRAMEADLKDSVDTINALVEELNRLATTLNITASKFNQIGSARGEEFTEGLYLSNADGEKIDIYQFDTRQKLVRVLAHEFGHALALEHVDDPSAIMYRLNQGVTEALAPSDIEALHALCGSK